MPNVLVKICGVRTPDDAAGAVIAGADMVGLNFFRGSRRFVEAAQAKEIVREIPESIWRVGVFVNASREEIEDCREQLALDAIQLHGDEPVDLELGWPIPVIRAVRLRSDRDADAALCQTMAKYLLCEGDAAGAYGGAGVSFSWSWAETVPRDRLIVAGGLRPETVHAAVAALRPFAVDVASGVESAPGVKDREKMSAFVRNAKEG